MTDLVQVAIVTGAFGTLTAAISAVGTILSRRAQLEAREAKAKVESVHADVQLVRAQAVDNFGISQRNHDTLEKVVKNTNGNVEKLEQAWAAEAHRRESAAWKEAFEAGKRAEMTKKRRTDDLEPKEPPVNDDEPKE